MFSPFSGVQRLYDPSDFKPRLSARLEKVIL